MRTAEELAVALVKAKAEAIDAKLVLGMVEEMLAGGVNSGVVLTHLRVLKEALGLKT